MIPNKLGWNHEFEWNLIRRNGETLLLIQWQEWNESWNRWSVKDWKKVPWEIVQVTIFVDIWRKKDSDWGRNIYFQANMHGTSIFSLVRCAIILFLFVWIVGTLIFST